jgi:hypothetical protein
MKTKRSIISIAVAGLLVASTSAFALGDADQEQGQAQGQGQGQLQGQGQKQGQAQGQLQGQGQGQGQGQAQSSKNVNVNSNKASAYSGASSYAKGGSAFQAQGQSVKQGQEVTGNSNNITFEDSGRADVHYSGAYEVKSVPNFALGGLYPSANCHGTSNAAVSVMGFGLGGGTSWEDTDCGLRETARSFQALGMNADAVAVLCSSKHSASAPTCAKAAAAKAAEAAKAEIVADRAPESKRKTSDERPLSASDQAILALKPDYCKDSVIASRRDECQ